MENFVRAKNRQKQKPTLRTTVKKKSHYGYVSVLSQRNITTVELRWLELEGTVKFLFRVIGN